MIKFKHLYISHQLQLLYLYSRKVSCGLAVGNDDFSRVTRLLINVREYRRVNQNRTIQKIYDLFSNLCCQIFKKKIN